MKDRKGIGRRLIVLGSTGSIGENTLEVAAHLREAEGWPIEVVGLAASRSAEKLIEQARRFGVGQVAISQASHAQAVREALPGVQVHAGPGAMRELVRSVDATDLAAAVVGAAGLEATLAGIQRGLRVSLANKETLVAAGPLVIPAVRAHGATLLPVDSEHSAIFQCLQSRAAACENGRASTHEVQRVVLTASGGPFRQTPLEAMRRATVEQALKHPTWTMGQKITIDSATMMNKALEIIEAHWLFDLPAERIEAIIHPQSIVHSFVEFVDRSVLAQLGAPDMKGPIQYALTWPQRTGGCSRAMDWQSLSELTFEPPDVERFPALRLAYEVIEAGGTAGAVFNAANEAAVEAFVQRRIPFGRIVELVGEALSATPARPIQTLADVLEADRTAREVVGSLVPGVQAG